MRPPAEAAQLLVGWGRAASQSLPGQGTQDTEANGGFHISIYCT